MKRQNIIPTKTGSRTAAVAGCLVATALMAIGTVAYGAESERDKDKPLGTAGTSSQSAEEQTMEGQLVPLFHYLKANGAIQGQQQGATQPGSRQPNATQPGSQGGARPLSTAQSEPSQPLLFIGQKEQQGSSAQRPGSPAGSTPGRTESQAQTPGTRPGATPGIAQGQAMSQKKNCILVFDPEDTQSRMAYQMAQTIAQSGLQEPSQTTPPPTLGSTPKARDPDNQTIPGIGSGRQPVRERERPDASQHADQMGAQVKITGKLVQHGGFEALVVKKVERSTSSPGLRSGQQNERPQTEREQR